MQEDNTGASGSPEPVGDKTQEDSVSYQTYKKTVGEVKSLKTRLAELEAEREAERMKRLQEEGKWKESAEDWSKKAKEAEEKAMRVARTFGQKVFANEVKSVALELGADPNALDDIIKVGDWSEIEIGDDFTVDREKLKSSIARMQQSKSFYFKKSVSAPRDVTPGNSPVGKPEKDLNELDMDDLLKLAKQIK